MAKEEAFKSKSKLDQESNSEVEFKLELEHQSMISDSNESTNDLTNTLIEKL